jgi:hypothetical protein
VENRTDVPSEKLYGARLEKRCPQEGAQQRGIEADQETVFNSLIAQHNG